jgi:HEAT repeat protein
VESSVPARIAVVVLSLMLVDASGALAQVNPYRVQQRYNDAKKGKSIDEWTKRLNDPDPTQRLEAVKSLGDSGQPGAVEYLIQATGDPSDAVKIKAIDYLGKLRATEATQVLVQKLFMRDVEPPLKQRILVALGRIGDTKAAQPISEFLKQDSDPAISGTAVFTLGEIGDASVIPHLEQMQRNASDPHLARLAGEAIQKIQLRISPASVAVTVPALVDEDQRPQAANRR